MDIETSTPTETFDTKDLSLAAYLLATNSVKLQGQSKLSNGTILFKFSPKHSALKFVSDYWNLSAAPIQPKQLFSAMRDLKDLIYST